MNALSSSVTGYFPSCYLPSVEYLYHLHQFTDVTIDVNNIFQKQTVRNRCFILSPNGIQCLSVPVIHASGVKQALKEIKISYAEPWQKIHWRAIKTAYGRSPYFEFIYEELEAIYRKQYEYLFELNIALLSFLLKKMKSKVVLCDLTNKIQTENMLSLAEAKSNIPITKITFLPYNQVFQNKFGFTPNLSALDLLFNTGNRATDLL
jgi:WbqC-like protein family